MVVPHPCEKTIERMLPAGVAVAIDTGAGPMGELYPEETRGAVSPGSYQHDQFVRGRACARTALARLGTSASAIPRRDDGSPFWPTQTTGSITHCPGLVAAVAAPLTRLAAIGIDAERADRRTRKGLERRVCTIAELKNVEAVGGEFRSVNHALLAFCAKEAVYKCIAPFVRRRVAFHEVELEMDYTSGTYQPRFAKSVEAALISTTRTTGRFAVCDNYIVALAFMPSHNGQEARMK